MPHEQIRVRAAVVCLLTAGAATAIPGQEVIRYAPVPGVEVRMLTEELASVTLFGFRMVPDGTLLRSERMLAATQRVFAATENGFNVELTLDSLRVRERLGEGRWTTITDTAGAPRTVRATLDSRFALVAAQSADLDILRLLGAGVVTGRFAFPTTPMPVGSPVATDGQVVLRVRVPQETGLAIDQRLVGALALTRDSTIGRGGDELTFFSFRGSFSPSVHASRSESGARSDEFTGGFAGRLIWSKAWNGFASGLVRFRVQGQFRDESPAGVVDTRAEWDVTVRHQIRS